MNNVNENETKATASNGWMIGADTAGLSTAIVDDSGETYLQWSQQQIGGGSIPWRYMGRYLTTIAGVCDGLTTESGGNFIPTGELTQIYANGTKIILIDNRGSKFGWGNNGANGSADAKKAKKAAHALGIPNDMYIFVDVEKNAGSLGNYLANYKAALESGTTKYKMGVYFNVGLYSTINSQYNLANTYTWVAKWESSLAYPNWPQSYSPAVSGKGQVKLWQFISDQYLVHTSAGNLMVDLNITTESTEGMKEFMYHPSL